jgi:hypothetical protein
VVVDAAGRLLLPQPRDGQVLVFDSNGTLTAKLGRIGQGPGEFRNIYSFGIAGDTMWASNYPNRQLHRFDTRGAYINTTSYAAVQGAGSFAPSGYVAGGRTLFRVETGDISDAPESLKSAYAELLFAVNAGGLSVTDTLARTRNTIELATLRRPNGETTSILQPLRQNAALAVSPDGDEVAVVELAGFAGNVAQVSVTRIRASDGVTQTTRIGLAGRPVPPGLVDSIVRDRAARAHRLVPGEWPTQAAAERAYRDVITAPRIMPAIAGAMLSVDGYLWLRLAGGEEWLVLDPRSIVTRRVVLPADASAKVAAVGRDFVVTKDINRDGDPQVVRYSIISAPLRLARELAVINSRWSSL